LSDCGHNDQAPKPQEEPLALLFRDNSVAIEALYTLKPKPIITLHLFSWQATGGEKMTSEYLQASCEIHKLISTEDSTSKKKCLSSDVHPVAVMLGLC
jgi:hypothetical protein